MTLLTNLFIAFGWLCFIALGMFTLCWLDNRNYWMPSIYIGWGIIFFVVTLWVSYIS